MEVLNKKIGIIGSGQLGRMTIQEARKMDIYTNVLTPEIPSPSSDISNDYIIGDLYDAEKIKELANKSDIITYEIEHINVEVLKELEESGTDVYPSSKVIGLIQDKSKQKELLNKNSIPTSDWMMYNDNIEEIVEKYGFPLVQKSCKGGYDGKGVFIIKNEKDIQNMIKGDSFFEKHIDFQIEVAVMVARNRAGDIKTYPLVEMVFDEKTNICDTVLVPARVSNEIKKEAEEIALKCIEALDGVGIFGVEMFLTKDNQILVNEIAPRPHNSGHYTIEACMTSQYEQYLRAIMDLPLGSTKLLSPAVMVNLVGEDKHTGNAIVKGAEDALAIEGAYLHIYGKRETKPFRKMGHATILDEDVKKAYEKAMKVKDLIRIETE